MVKIKTKNIPAVLVLLVLLAIVVFIIFLISTKNIWIASFLAIAVASTFFYTYFGEAIFDWHADPNVKTIKKAMAPLKKPGQINGQEWKGFIQKLSYKAIFLHKDEFVRLYANFDNTPFPAVFGEKNGKIVTLRTPKEINRLHSLSEMKNLVLSKVNRTSKIK